MLIKKTLIQKHLQEEVAVESGELLAEFQPQSQGEKEK